MTGEPTLSHPPSTTIAVHPSHKEQASMIRRYIIWRNNHAYAASTGRT